MTDRPSLHVRKRIVRNLRAAPAGLTEARISRILAMLDAAPRRAAPVAEPAPTVPEAPATIDQIGPAAPAVSVVLDVAETIVQAELEDAVEAFLAPIAAMTIEPPAARAPRPHRAKPTPTARPIERSEAPAEKAASVAAAPAVRATPAPRPPRSSALAPEVARPRPAATVVSPPTVRSASTTAFGGIGVQNASVAIAWLRSNGISVKAESTSVFGTRWLVSNEYATFDSAGILALARRKGFAG